MKASFQSRQNSGDNCKNFAKAGSELFKGCDELWIALFIIYAIRRIKGEQRCVATKLSPSKGGVLGWWEKEFAIKY